MTFFHFGNCIALAYVPYMIVYKSSGLSEYSAFWKCVQAAAAYLVTQLCKMLFLATFFPASDTVIGQFDILGELFKSTVDLADLVGIHLVMSQIAGKGQLKFMIAGVGWASAELIMTGILPLWFGARGVEFDWKYVQMSLDSNVSLLHHITTATLVWLYSRTDLNRMFLPVVVALLAFSCYRPLIIEVLTQFIGLSAWMMLLMKALLTASVGMIALQIYVGLSSSKDSNSYL